MKPTMTGYLAEHILFTLNKYNKSYKNKFSNIHSNFTAIITFQINLSKLYQILFSFIKEKNSEK